jgi:hypothetical protein
MAIGDSPDGVVSFERDIVELFRPMDIQCMRGRVPPVLLADYEYMKVLENAQLVLSYLKGDNEPRMPFGGPYWNDDALKLFQDWITGGLQP